MHFHKVHTRNLNREWKRGKEIRKVNRKLGTSNRISVGKLEMGIGTCDGKGEIRKGKLKWELRLRMGSGE